MWESVLFPSHGNSGLVASTLSAQPPQPSVSYNLQHLGVVKGSGHLVHFLVFCAISSWTWCIACGIELTRLQGSVQLAIIAVIIAWAH